MRLPRDLSGADLVKRLERLGYKVSRQTGSHLRLTCDEPQRHHVTIPNRDLIRLGTPATIMADSAERRRLDRDELLRLLIEGKP